MLSWIEQVINLERVYSNCEIISVLEKVTQKHEENVVYIIIPYVSILLVL